MKNEEVFLTQEQLQNLQDELEYYIHTKRPEIVANIREAKSFGDLSENSEYDSAREEQAFVEAKIKELEAKISNAQVYVVQKSDVVVLGTTVTYENVETKEKFTYKITGDGADPLDKTTPTISTAAPIARALFEKGKGDIVEVEVPNGYVKLKILKVE
ncbi:MAG: transcription elongation factor GreA [Mycoplasmatales bacterium]